MDVKAVEIRRSSNAPFFPPLPISLSLSFLSPLSLFHYPHPKKYLLLIPNVAPFFSRRKQFSKKQQIRK